MNRNLLALATAAAAAVTLSACVVVPEPAPYGYRPAPVYGRVVVAPPRRSRRTAAAALWLVRLVWAALVAVSTSHRRCLRLLADIDRGTT